MFCVLPNARECQFIDRGQMTRSRDTVGATCSLAHRKTFAGLVFLWKLLASMCYCYYHLNQKSESTTCVKQVTCFAFNQIVDCKIWTNSKYNWGQYRDWMCACEGDMLFPDRFVLPPVKIVVAQQFTSGIRVHLPGLEWRLGVSLWLNSFLGWGVISNVCSVGYASLERSCNVQ